MENLVSPSFIWTWEKVESISRWLYPEMDSVLSLICVYGLLEKAIKNCHNGLYRITEIWDIPQNPSFNPTLRTSLFTPPTPHHPSPSPLIYFFFFCSFLSLIKHVLFLLRKPHAGAYTEGRGLWDLKPRV